jgi:Ca2+-binding RTX toxin-like protein
VTTTPVTPTAPTTSVRPTTTNTLTGTSAANSLTGTSANDLINGGAGDDKIWAKNGSDVLIGGAGKDTFTFDTKPGSSNVDMIVDFNVADDTIRLNDTVFTKLKYGQLSSSSFVTGEKALDAGDRIIYNDKTGALSYDADGTGSAAAVQFAMIENLAKLTAADFIVI